MVAESSAGMKLGELFTTSEAIETRPCVHCGEPVVEIDGGPIHFEVDAETGGKTAWMLCTELVGGRRKRSGTSAEVAA